VSGALYDRIDMAIDVPAVEASAMASTANGESSAAVRDRVVFAHGRQLERQGKANGRLAPSEVERHCRRSSAAEALLAQAMSRMSLSARGYHRVVKVARTVADLAGASSIDAIHVAEAIAYRRELTAA